MVPYCYMNLSIPQKTLLQLLGPSIVFVALSISGGELLLWPDLISRYGLTILIFIPLILLLQFFVNIEIERYTVVTGKNTLRALIEKASWISILFPIAIVISLMWPAWISTAGNILAHSVGATGQGAMFSIIMLIMLLVLWQSKESYAMMERIAKAGLVIVLGIVTYTLLRIFDSSIILSSIEQGTMFPAGSDALLFISALAYGGVAGVLNLVQSDWVKSKGYAAANTDVLTPIDWNTPETQTAWKKWWPIILKEHTLLFVVGNIIGIIMLGTLAALLLPGSGAKGFGILVYQVDILNATVPYLGLLFGIGVCLIFIMAQMAILDAAGRLLKQCFIHSNTTHERLSQGVGIIGVGILLITIFHPAFNQPSILLQISATLSAGIMALYAPLLLRINKELPLIARPRLRHYAGILLCSLFYGSMTLWALYHILFT